ncbi:hypothetical protein SISSUDRAFT_1067614 [Sistotremastrum suecicum HHB10207 ss-3]|uniref:Uncharacterized protein n=1 Tax=Sistotremastrum suecicum HHB10207 ss-3 TaxID=1314776 RepID=A0A165WXG7_9AGAM|nr:hypothetical protein SISSUDRAFT_1067614 [Sistotremastrum suecicum HHB10207 ss-3]
MSLIFASSQALSISVDSPTQLYPESIKHSRLAIEWLGAPLKGNGIPDLAGVLNAALGKTFARFYEPYKHYLIDLLMVSEDKDDDVDDDPATLDIIDFLDANSAPFRKLRSDAKRAEDLIAY